MPRAGGPLAGGRILDQTSRWIMTPGCTEKARHGPARGSKGRQFARGHSAGPGRADPSRERGRQARSHRGPGGFRITPYDPGFAETMELAEAFMSRYRERPAGAGGAQRYRLFSCPQVLFFTADWQFVPVSCQPIMKFCACRVMISGAGGYDCWPARGSGVSS